MLHYIVTGGCGFIGSHLVERLIAAECAVTVVDDMRNGKFKIVDSPYVAYIHEDVCDVDITDKVYQADGIIHLANTPRIRLAFEQPVDAIMNNIGPTTHVCEWAKRLNCPLYFGQSSSRIFGHADDNPYALGKAFGEEVMHLYQRHWGLDYRLMYFYNVYGPREADYGEHSTVIRSFKKAYLAGESLKIFGTGHKSRDFTHVKDVVEGVFKSLYDEKKRKQIHLGSGESYTINDIAEAFNHPMIYEFDKPGEAQHTICKDPYINRTHNVIKYITDWTQRKHNA